MATPSPQHLMPSDYLVGAALVTGTIGTYSFFVEQHPVAAGYFTLGTTILVALSQWLYSRGD